jgi:transposase InsO family protein
VTYLTSSNLNKAGRKDLKKWNSQSSAARKDERPFLSISWKCRSAAVRKLLFFQKWDSVLFLGMQNAVSTQCAAGLMHHSDQGVTYSVGEKRRLLERFGIVASMSRKGDGITRL